MHNYKLADLNNFELSIKQWNIIFLYWDLASGKTTFAKHIINNLLWVEEKITSPTYNYYNKYKVPESIFLKNNINCYHFDLYRIKNYDEFFNIWGEDILNNNNDIFIIEWPQVIEKYFEANIKIFLEKTDFEDQRLIKIEN